MFSTKFSALILPSVVALALLVAPAYSATITTYNTSSSWQVALSSFQTIDFSGLAPVNGATTYGSGLTVNGVQFSGLSGGSSAFGVLDTTLSSWFNFGTGDAAFINTDRATNATPVPYLHIVLPAPVTAVGFNIFSASPNALSYTVSVPAGQYSVPTNALPTPAFWGITSDTPFSTVDLTLQGTVFNGGSKGFMDNFAFGSATPDVPESSTSILIGSGLAGIGLLRRRASRGVRR
ncbi:MAG TPA: PEP-CTERM sorting domain-containing protein [Bryobacteraceae bacterium]|nr:PEP-CTERM sorting domain-containing protein [Bryobacteraceae bacterium]